MRTALPLLLVILGALWLFVGLPRSAVPPRGPAPPPPLPPVLAQGYAGRATCESCHRETAHAWGESPHGRHAVARGTPLGGADLAVGSVWMQAYLKRDAEGWHRILPQCLDLRETRWRPVTEVLEAIAGPRGDRPAMTEAMVAGRDFDTQCAGCHTSGPSVAIDLVSGRLRSGWRDAAIDCEACHGPGLAHAESWRRLDAEPVHMPRLESLPAAQAVALCARCHGGPPAAGDFGLADAVHFVGSLQTDARQTPDGTSLGQGYQYAAFSRSPCYTRGGLTCTGCHDPHGPGRRPFAHADALCTRCHEDHAARAHHHHPPASAGARCVACHMPQLLDGVMAHQRDHRIGSPLPHGAAVRDACTACHADRDKAWAVRAYAGWWGEPDAATHQAVVALALAEERAGAGREDLAAAQIHPDPWIRARAGELLGDLGRLLQDPVAEVRLHGLVLAARAPDALRWLEVARGDAHPRIRGQALALLGERGGLGEDLTPEQREDLGVFVRQVRGAAGARLRLAAAEVAAGRCEAAVEHLTQALGVEPDRTEGWALLIQAYERLHDGDAVRLATVRWAEAHGRALARGRLAPAAFQAAVAAEITGGRADLARVMLQAALERLAPGPARIPVEQMLARLRATR